MIARSLVTDRLTLRAPRKEDLEAFTHLCASDRTRFAGGPFSTGQASRTFSAILGHWALRGFGSTIITQGDAALGHVGATQLGPAEPPEVTWALWTAGAEGKGFATNAARAVWNAGTWPSMILRILPQNGPSLRLAERLGAMRIDMPAPAWLKGCHTYRLSRTEGTA